MYYNLRTPYTNELYHHGIKGQKWGVRRYQNPDGSLTAEGRIRYGVGTRKKHEGIEEDKIAKVAQKIMRKYERERAFSKIDKKLALD